MLEIMSEQMCHGGLTAVVIMMVTPPDTFGVELVPMANCQDRLGIFQICVAVESINEGIRYHMKGEVI